MKWFDAQRAGNQFISSHLNGGRSFESPVNPPPFPVASPRLIVRLAALPSFSQPRHRQWTTLKNSWAIQWCSDITNLGLCKHKAQTEGRLCHTRGFLQDNLLSVEGKYVQITLQSQMSLFFQDNDQLCSVFRQKGVSSNSDYAKIANARGHGHTNGVKRVPSCFEWFFSSSVFVLMQAQTKAKQSY